MKKQYFGEYITFIISLIIVSGLAVFLTSEILKEKKSESIHFASKVLWNEIKNNNDSVTVPVEIENESPQTVKLLKVKVNAGEESFEVELEYLGSKTPKKVFLVMPSRPSENDLKITPIYYLLD